MWGGLAGPDADEYERNPMRFRMSTSVAVCFLVAAFGAVGCSPENSSSAAGGSATTGSGSSTQAGTGTSTLASAQQSPTVASVGKCQATNLSFGLGDKHQLVQGQWAQVVDMTNKGLTACTMQGVPTVDLIGDTSSQPSTDWTLESSSAKGAQVTLQPGATAHFDLVYLSGDLASGGGGKDVIAVQEMVIKAPGDTNQSDGDVQGTLAWAQGVVLQEGATHPGTYVMPVASGS
jgi:Protein of unknown function (DUF4232)